MTEKRFTIDDGYGQTVYWHIKEGGVVIGKKCGQKHIAYVVERLNQLYDENEQLKQDNQRLIKMLDNVANYMQKEHREIPLDDFVEWWNKMATEGLEND